MFFGGIQSRPRWLQLYNVWKKTNGAKSGEYCGWDAVRSLVRMALLFPAEEL